MNTAIIIALALGASALACALLALYIALGNRRRPPATPVDTSHKAEQYTAITSMLSDGAMVWQRLIQECDNLAEGLPISVLSGPNRDAVGDWLQQLREFCHGSRQVIDQSYDLFSAEARRMTASDMEMRYPEMERFNREMKSNIVVISGQLKHLKNVLRGVTSLDKQPLKITLHKPQAMPHFLRKRRKIAELQARQVDEDTEPA